MGKVVLQDAHAKNESARRVGRRVRVAKSRDEGVAFGRETSDAKGGAGAKSDDRCNRWARAAGFEKLFGRENVMPGNEPKLVTMKNNNSNNKENKAEKKLEPVDYTSPSATPSSTKKAEKEKKVFTLETPPLTASVEKKKKAEQQQQQQQKSGALEEKKQQQQEAQKRAEKTSHEMSVKKSRSGSRSPSESLTSAGSEEIAKKQLIEALSGVSIKEEEQKKEKTTKMV